MHDGLWVENVTFVAFGGSVDMPILLSGLETPLGAIKEAAVRWSDVKRIHVPVGDLM